MSPTLLDPSCSRLLKPSLVFGIFSYEIICIIITQSCHVKIRSLYLENVAVSWLKYFLVSSNDQVRCNCWTNPSCSSKESYLSRCPCLKLKRSCSKSCRCRYCVNGKWRETDPFKDKLNSCRCRSRGKSESLSACSNTFGKYKSRCPCLKSKRACSTDCACIGCHNSYGIRQLTEVENSKKISRAKREDKKYIRERTTKYLKMQGEELLHSTWTLGETVLLYCVVQFLQNNNLEITTEIIHHLYTKLQEINGVGLNNRTKSLKQIEAKITYMQRMQHPQWSQH